MRKLTKRLLSVFLALTLVLSLGVTAFADDETDTTTGTITVKNATIGETYHAYKLFDATYSESGSVTYVATEAQKTALEAYSGNVFDFTAISATATTGEDGETTYSYQVTVKDGVTDAEVIAFIESFYREVGSLVYFTFPGATEVTSMDDVSYTGLDNDHVTATASTVAWSGVDFGYYFVTSSLGSIVMINTAAPSATISEKNSSETTWDNEDWEPDDPVKNVLDVDDSDEDNVIVQNIDGQEVSVGDTLTYEIAWSNDCVDSDGEGQTVDSVTIKDAAPDGTGYVENSAAIQVLDASGNNILTNGTGTVTVTGTDENGATTTETITVTGTVSGPDNDDGITWTVSNLPYGYTVVATFQVTVTNAALEILTDEETGTLGKTVVNDADVTVVALDNTYDLTTNLVKNPVDEPGAPDKDVYAVTEGIVGTASIDGEEVGVGETLQYAITYTNPEYENSQTVTITDQAPTNTTYVANSAAYTILDADGDDVTVTNGSFTYGDEDTSATVTVSGPDTGGDIVWTVTSLPAGYTVVATFQVTVDDGAEGETIVNDAYVTAGENNCWTNVVTNSVPEEPENPEDPNPGKVIVNADGTETDVSTGAYGDTVSFKVSVNAVNIVEQEVEGEDGETTTQNVQVTSYYIYDRLDAGFTLDADTLSLEINGTTYTVTEDTTQSYTSNGVTTYTITDSSGAEVGTLFVAAVDEDNDGTADYTLIAVTIPWVDDDGAALYPNCKVYLTYEATINTNAVIAEDGNLNRAIYDYATTADDEPTEPDPENPEYPDGEDLNHGSEEKVTTTYTYALAIQKVDSETGEPLADATFILQNSDDEYITASGSDGIYSYTGTTDDSSEATSLTTNADGQIIIKGVDVGTYEFTETAAPDGYKLLTESVSVTATMDSSTTTYTESEWTVTRYFTSVTIDSEDDFNEYDGDLYTRSGNEGSYEFTLATSYSANETYYALTDSTTEGATSGTTHTVEFDVSVTALSVLNSSGSLLPSTGGIGTTLFYILGAILVLGAGILLIVRRRMGAGK